MDVTTQLKLCLHEQTQIVANAASRVGSQQFLSLIANFCSLTFYCDLYFLFNFFNFYLFLVIIRMWVHYKYVGHVEIGYIIGIVIPM